jgi:hypothetical protein
MSRLKATAKGIRRGRCSRLKDWRAKSLVKKNGADLSAPTI